MSLVLKDVSQLMRLMCDSVAVMCTQGCTMTHHLGFNAVTSLSNSLTQAVREALSTAMHTITRQVTRNNDFAISRTKGLTQKLIQSGTRCISAAQL